MTVAVLTPMTVPEPSASLAEPGSGERFVRFDASLLEAVRLFQTYPDMRLLPVVDGERRPTGAIFEKDVRRILFNPYGHALLSNPSFGATLSQRVRSCPMAEVGDSIGDMLDSYARAGGREGMILTRDGRLEGVILNQALVRAAALHEGERMRARAAYYDRLRLAGQRFEADLADLAGTIGRSAGHVDDAALAVAERGRATGIKCATVASAAAQTDATLAAIAGHSSGLAEALVQLHDETKAAKLVAVEAAMLVDQGNARAEGLAETAGSIRTILALIESLAGKVRMLAINATIEAARAGEAGRGFAVVAGEVKSLAAQTRDAAEQVAARLTDVQTTIDGVVAGQGGIARVIATVGGLARSVDDAVAAQQSVTRILAEDSSEAMLASRDIRDNAEEISRTSQDAAAGALAMQGTARDLSGAAGLLSARVAVFLAEMQGD
jgi:methyl-accepting chemotaxis protein